VLEMLVKRKRNQSRRSQLHLFDRNSGSSRGILAISWKCWLQEWRRVLKIRFVWRRPIRIHWANYQWRQLNGERRDFEFDIQHATLYCNRWIIVKTPRTRNELWMDIPVLYSWPILNFLFLIYSQFFIAFKSFLGEHMKIAETEFLINRAKFYLNPASDIGFKSAEFFSVLTPRNCQSNDA
jgi:hypothetical protein